MPFATSRVGFSPYRMTRTLIAFKFAISMSNDLVLLPDTMSSKLFSHKHVKIVHTLTLRKTKQMLMPVINAVLNVCADSSAAVSSDASQCFVQIDSNSQASDQIYVSANP